MASASQKVSSVSPRLLRRERAAAYLDISAGSFDKLVRDGILPPAKVLHSFKVWDRTDLDALADTLPYENGNDKIDTSWDD